MRTAARLALTTMTMLACACGPRGDGAVPPTPSAAPASDRIAVLPFRTGGFLDPEGRFVADPTNDVPEDTGREAATRLSQQLAAEGAGVVDAQTVLRATPVAGAALYDSALATRVAREVGAGVAVMGSIRRYVQRVGSALGVESPASVEYQALLVDAGTGAALASYKLDYTQQPLAADLTDLPSFLQGGGKWRTREEILDRSLQATAGKIAEAVRSHGAQR